MTVVKIGFCSIGLRDLPLDQAVLHITAAGFEDIEVWHRHVSAMSDEELIEVANRAREQGVRFTVISPYFSFTQGQKACDESLRTGEKAVAAARLLGIRKIRTFVDIGREGRPSSVAEESHWQQARQGLQALCAIEPSMDFVVETHVNTLADSLPTVKRLITEVDRPNFKLNFQANPDFLERGYFECLLELWPHVSHMHLQQILEGNGEGYMEDAGVLDFRRLANMLKERNYSGTASVEYCWKDVDPARIPTAHHFLSGLGVA